MIQIEHNSTDIGTDDGNSFDLYDLFFLDEKIGELSFTYEEGNASATISLEDSLDPRIHKLGFHGQEHLLAASVMAVISQQGQNEFYFQSFYDDAGNRQRMTVQPFMRDIF